MELSVDFTIGLVLNFHVFDACEQHSHEFFDELDRLGLEAITRSDF